MDENNSLQSSEDRHIGLRNLGSHSYKNGERVDSTDKNTKDQTMHENERPLDTIAELRKKANTLLWKIILVFILLGAIIWGIGKLEFNFLTQLETVNLSSSAPKFELVDAHKGIVLMIKHEDKCSNINVQKINENNWRNISMFDCTVKNPSLSPNGKEVAYISGKNFSHVVVTSIDSNIQKVIEIKYFDKSLTEKATKLRNSFICDWSQIKWAPNGTHLSFFACNKTVSGLESYAVVIDLNAEYPIIVWIEDEANIQQNRNLVWLDDTHLMISAIDMATNVENIHKVSFKLNDNFDKIISGESIPD